MRSPMVMNSNFINDKERYSDLMVLSSGAGYYIGTMYYTPDGYIEPGTRDSDYYRTYSAASKLLSILETLNDEERADILRDRF